MVTSSILGLPAVLLVLMSMSCINLGSEPESAKNKRSVFGGILILLTGKPVFVFLKLRSYYTKKLFGLRNRLLTLPPRGHILSPTLIIGWVKSVINCKSQLFKPLSVSYSSHRHQLSVAQIRHTSGTHESTCTRCGPDLCHYCLNVKYNQNNKMIFLFFLSFLWHRLHCVVSHRGPSRERSDVLWLLPVFRLGGNCTLFARRLYDHLLFSGHPCHIHWQQQILLLQTGPRPSWPPLH